MHCAVENCDRPVYITTPLPLCRTDALNVARHCLRTESHGKSEGSGDDREK